MRLIPNTYRLSAGQEKQLRSLITQFRSTKSDNDFQNEKTSEISKKDFIKWAEDKYKLTFHGTRDEKIKQIMIIVLEEILYRQPTGTFLEDENTVNVVSEEEETADPCIESCQKPFFDIKTGHASKYRLIVDTNWIDRHFDWNQGGSKSEE